MKERPILFSAPMVRALLAGTKTQTRRALRIQPAPLPSGWHWEKIVSWWYAISGSQRGQNIGKCPYGQPGDRLWVREAWRTSRVLDKQPPRLSGVNSPFWYLADGGTKNVVAGRDNEGRYRHARFMPRWASCITLEVVAVRVERLQEIREADAQAEGVQHDPDLRVYHVEGEFGPCNNAKDSYACLWESINGPGSWDANPWVWVVEFKRIEEAA